MSSLVFDRMPCQHAGVTTPVRPYRGVSADERRAARRAALVDAGLEVMGASHPRPLTMTAICERAGLTERYFYESFTHRDALLLEVMDSIAVEVMDASVSALDAGDGQVEARARASIRAMVGVLTADPRKGRAALVTSLSVPVLRARRQELLAGFERLVADRTRQMYGDRAWAAPDDRIQSLLFVGGLAELLSAWLTGALDVGPDAIVDAATRQYLATAHR